MLNHLSHAVLVLAFCGVVAAPMSAIADEPITLIGTIVSWRYPDATLSAAEMSDANTVDALGNRTVPSSLLKTTLTTPDSVEKVLDFYRTLLTGDETRDESLGLDATAGQSVVFSDESAGRPFAFHTIVVNTHDRSTTLVITRGPDESQTHITWKQYIRHDIRR